MGKSLVEVRVALPKSFWIAIIEPGVASIVRLIEGASSPWQGVSVAHINRFSGIWVGQPISLMVFGITPFSVGVPVPRFNPQFRAETIGQGFQAHRFHGLYIRTGEDSGKIAMFVTIEACPERILGREVLNDVVWQNGDRRLDGLTTGQYDECGKYQRECSTEFEGELFLTSD